MCCIYWFLLYFLRIIKCSCSTNIHVYIGNNFLKKISVLCGETKRKVYATNVSEGVHALFKMAVLYTLQIFDYSDKSRNNRLKRLGFGFKIKVLIRQKC